MKSPRRYWSAADEWILRQLFANTPTRELAPLLGRNEPQVSQKAKKLGLRKSAKYLASPAACRLRRGDDIGASTRFKKGHAPANKGLRRPGWAPGRMRQTQFAKGSKPHTWKPIGSFRHSKEGYLQRKVTDTGYPPRDWKAEHILLWEEHLGPLPAGFAVCFKNGDKADIRIDNLALVSRADLMRRNSYHNYPKPIARLIQLRGAVVRQINRRSRNEQQQ